MSGPSTNNTTHIYVLRTLVRMRKGAAEQRTLLRSVAATHICVALMDWSLPLLVKALTLPLYCC